MVGPLLLAIYEMNAKAVAAMVKHDKSLNLRESLRGPALKDSCWILTYTKKVQGAEIEMTRKFSNLGMALLVTDDDIQLMAVLV